MYRHMGSMRVLFFQRLSRCSITSGTAHVPVMVGAPADQPIVYVGMVVSLGTF
jgi:hypothetical protein